MRILFLLTLFCCTSFLSIAQPDGIPADIKWGPEFAEPNKTVISKVLTSGGDLYAVRQKITPAALTGNRKIYLEKYNAQMEQVKAQDITLKYKGKHLDFEELISLNNNLFLLSSFHNKAKKKNFLFTQMINMRTLDASKSLKKIGEIDTRGINREGNFGLHISRDSSKVLIFSNMENKKNDPETFAVNVYNDQFEEIWSKNIRLPYDEDKFTVEEYRVDRKGNVYFLGVIYQDKAKLRRRGLPNYQYTILAYTNNGEDFEEYKIKIDDRFITDLTFRVADDGDLICSGFYSDKGTYSVKGTYFFRVNPETQEMYNDNFKEFEFDFVTDLMSDRKKEKAMKAERTGNTKKQAELYSYSLDKLILRSDGGALLIAEQYFVERDEDYYSRYGYGYYGWGNPWNRGFNDVDYYYNYNDIIVVNIRPDGEIEWTARIPKRQETANDGGYFSSYAMSIVRDKIYFIFNDNIKNFQEDRRNDRIYGFNGNRSIIALAEVSRDGSVFVYPLASNREAGTLTRPKICKQIGRNTMAVYGERGRKFRFANLEFLPN
jgi:hypothetical protein